jgi:uracil-DNA glycosylase
LRRAQELVHQGEMEARKILAEVNRELAAEPQVVVDYLAIVEPRTLQPVERVSIGCVALIAAKVGPTRLIDNLILGSPSASPEQLLQSALSAVIKMDTRTRFPGLEAEMLRQRVENCRECAAIPSILLPPREFMVKYLKAHYPDLNVVEGAVIGRDSPMQAENFFYSDPNRRNAFVAGVLQLLGLKDFQEFKTRFLLTDALRCHSTDLHAPERALENCARHLQAELKLFPNLKTIVLLGEDAYQQFQRLLGVQASGQIVPFSEKVRENGWSCEEVVVSWLDDRRLRVFCCYHPTLGYLRSPSIGPMLTPDAPEQNLGNS